MSTPSHKSRLVTDGFWQLQARDVKWFLEPTAEVLQRALLQQQQRPLLFPLQQTPGSAQRAEDLSFLRRHVKYQPGLQREAPPGRDPSRDRSWWERFCGRFYLHVEVQALQTLH